MRTDRPRGGARSATHLRGVIIGSVGGLLAVVSLLYSNWGPGTVVATIPWFIPMIFTFLSLTAISVAFLSLGRYTVLEDPVSYWVGLGFASFAVGLSFYVLTWPGLLPDGQSVVARLPNTPAWMAQIASSFLGIFLLAAGLDRFAGEQSVAGRRWHWSIVAWLAFVTLFATLSVAFEQLLPTLVGGDGAFTSLLLAWNGLLAVLFVSGFVLSVRRYQSTGDLLLGYVALSQVAFALAILTSLIVSRRYDLWWYTARIILVGGSLALLFGLLSEYVSLLRREREKSRDLGARTAALQAVLRNSPNPIYVTDKQGAVLYASEAGLKMLRIDRLEDVSRPLAEWAPAYETRDREGRLLGPEQVPLARVARGERFHGEEVRFRDLANNSTIWLLVSGAPLVDESGERIGGVLVGTDITERKAVEEQSEGLLRAEQEARTLAEKAVRARDEFISIAAHELKTPVTSLRGFAQLMLRDMDTREPVDPGRLSKAMMAIDQQSKRLARLTDQLLNLSRLESGRLAINPEWVALDELVENAVDDVRHSHPRRALALDSTGQIWAAVDPLRFSQVVVNLLDNALKFSPLDTTVEVTLSDQGDSAVLAVRDYGPGISAGERERIFERYYQAHDERQYGGMGIGLYVSRQIVRLHGGTIDVESLEDGSRFVVRIPLDRGSDAIPHAEAPRRFGQVDQGE